MTGVTAHMIVKNEDQLVWYAINSVLPYVDRFLITDTGSTDQTIKVIKSIKSSKIFFEQVITHHASEVSAVRSRQLADTKTDWLWIVDADEVYPHALAQEILQVVKADHYEGIVVRRYDLLGDVYHRQIESVGTYELFGKNGHLLTRLVNQQKIKGLHYQGDYPNEGFFDQSNRSTRERDPRHWYITKHSLYHAMYLKRSSLGSKLTFMPNRSKYKIEKGLLISDNIPEVFSFPRPSFVPDPLIRRSGFYELTAAVLTPIKNLYRSIK